MRFFQRKNIKPGFILIQNWIINKEIIKYVKLLDIVKNIDAILLGNLMTPIENIIIIEIKIDNNDTIRISDLNNAETKKLFERICCELKN